MSAGMTVVVGLLGLILGAGVGVLAMALAQMGKINDKQVDD